MATVAQCLGYSIRLSFSFLPFLPMAWLLLMAGWMSLMGSAEEVQAPEHGKSQPLSQDGARVTVSEQICLSSVFVQFCRAHKPESSLLTPNGKRNIVVLDRC